MISSRFEDEIIIAGSAFGAVNGYVYGAAFAAAVLMKPLI